MIDLILMVALNALVALPQTQPAVCREEAPAMFAQFRPCVWPNKCTTESEPIAQVRPCVWPNTCAEQVQPIAQFRPCVWPNKCSTEQDSI